MKYKVVLFSAIFLFLIVSTNAYYIYDNFTDGNNFNRWINGTTGNTINIINYTDRLYMKTDTGNSGSTVINGQMYSYMAENQINNVVNLSFNSIAYECYDGNTNGAYYADASIIIAAYDRDDKTKYVALDTKNAHCQSYGLGINIIEYGSNYSIYKNATTSDFLVVKNMSSTRNINISSINYSGIGIQTQGIRDIRSGTLNGWGIATVDLKSVWYYASKLPTGTIGNSYPSDGSNLILISQPITTNITANITNNNTKVSHFIDNLLVYTANVTNSSNPLLIQHTATINDGPHTDFWSFEYGTNVANSTPNTWNVTSFNLTSNLTPANNTKFRTNSITFSQLINSTNGINVTLYINQLPNKTIELGSGVQNISFNNILSTGNYNFSLNVTSRSYSTMFPKNTMSIDLNSYINSSTYFNYVNAYGSNWTNNLSFNVTIDGCNNNVTLFMVQNNVITRNSTYSCSGFISNITGSYVPTIDGLFNFSINASGFNGFGNYNINTPTQLFNGLLSSPTIVLNFTQANNVFGVNSAKNVSIQCLNRYPNLTYYHSLNANVLINNAIYPNGTTIINSTSYSDGTITQFGSCSNPFFTTNTTNIFSVVSKTIFLVDEFTGNPFQVLNISVAKLWLGDNVSFYDFRANNVSSVNVTTVNNTKVRIDLQTYPGGSLIQRYIDLSLLSNNTQQIRVCANYNTTPQYYQQILYSQSPVSVSLVNSYSLCYIDFDYTRFGYQQSNALQAFTTNTNYYLSTTINNAQVLLASIDGSLAQNINLDALIFQSQATKIQTVSSTLIATPSGINQTTISYVDIKNQTTFANVTISNALTGQVYMQYNMSTPNNFNIIFNYQPFDLSSNPQFKITMTRVRNGVTETLTQYFSDVGKSALLSSKLGFMIAFLLILFGMSMTVSKVEFSWFGIMIQLGAIAILSFTTGAWYITFMQALAVISIVWIVFIMLNKNTAQVA